MGCCNNRQSINQVQNYLRRTQILLNFRQLDCSLIDKNFTRYAIDDKLNNQQLLQALNSLNIMKCYRESFQIKEYFFNMFNQEGQNCSLIRLSTMGVLLGKNQNSKKAKILFQNYDRDYSGTLQQTELNQMIEDMAKICIDYIGQTTVYEQPKNKKMIQDYCYELRNKVPEFKNFMWIIFGNEGKIVISLQDFIYAFNQRQMASLLSSGGFRKFISGFN